MIEGHAEDKDLIMTRLFAQKRPHQHCKHQPKPQYIKGETTEAERILVTFDQYAKTYPGGNYKNQDTGETTQYQGIIPGGETKPWRRNPVKMIAQ